MLPLTEQAGHFLRNIIFAVENDKANSGGIEFNIRSLCVITKIAITKVEVFVYGESRNS